MKSHQSRCDFVFFVRVNDLVTLIYILKPTKEVVGQAINNGGRAHSYSTDEWIPPWRDDVAMKTEAGIIKIKTLSAVLSKKRCGKNSK